MAGLLKQKMQATQMQDMDGDHDNESAEQGGLEPKEIEQLSIAANEGQRMLYEQKMLDRIVARSKSGEPVPAVIADIVAHMTLAFKQNLNPRPRLMSMFMGMMIMQIVHDLKELGLIQNVQKLTEDALKATIAKYLQADPEAANAVARAAQEGKLNGVEPNEEDMQLMQHTLNPQPAQGG